MQISCDSPFSSPGHGGGAPSPFPGAAAPLARRRPRTPAGLPLGWGGPGQDSGVTEPGKGVPDLGEGGGTGMPGMGGESRASRLGRGGGVGGGFFLRHRRFPDIQPNFWQSGWPRIVASTPPSPSPSPHHRENPLPPPSRGGGGGGNGRRPRPPPEGSGGGTTTGGVRGLKPEQRCNPGRGERGCSCLPPRKRSPWSWR